VLPTAARRQVEQRMNNPAREARKALRAETAKRFPYRNPRIRAIEPMARAVVEYGDSAEALLIMATLERLPRDQRLDVVETLAQIDTEPGRRAFLIASTTVLNVGQQLDLMREVGRLRGQAAG
jgi:hypothetical protein